MSRRVDLTASHMILIIPALNAPVAQLDRVPGYEPGGREFESLRAHHLPAFMEGMKNQKNRVILLSLLRVDNQQAILPVKSQLWHIPCKPL